MGVKSFFVANAFFALMFSLLAFAAVEDFSYSSYNNFEACACSYFAIPADIVNLGDVPSTYYLSLNGNAKGFTTIVPAEFSIIENSDSQRTYYYFNIPCDSIGKYSLQTDVNTALGSYKSFTTQINVKKCSFFSASVISKTSNVCPGKNATFQIRISNPLIIDEIISVRSIDNPASSADFSGQGTEASYLLAPNSTGYIILNVDPKGLANGYHEFKVSFRGKNSGYAEELTLAFQKVAKCTTADKVSIFDKFFSKSKNDVKQTKKATPNKGIISSQNIKVLLITASILLLILFILLLIIAITKARRRRHKHLDDKKLDEWIEVPIPKKEKKAELAVKAEKTISQKKINSRKKSAETVKKITKTNLNWVVPVVIILLLLLLLAGIGFTVYKNSDWILSKISGNDDQSIDLTNKSAAAKAGTNVEYKNISDIIADKITVNQTKTGFFGRIFKLFYSSNSSAESSSTNITKQPSILDKLFGKKPAIKNNTIDNLNQTIYINGSNANLSTSVNANVTSNATNQTTQNYPVANVTNGTFENIPYGFNPSSIFVDRFSNWCSIMIAVSLIIFIISLLALTISVPKDPKKRYFAGLKYGLPIFFFFLLTFLVIYCYIGGDCVATVNCTDYSTTSSITTNTSYSNLTDVTVQKGSIDCTCKTYTILGLPFWLFAVFMAMILVLFFIFLIYFIGKKGQRDVDDNKFFKSESHKTEKIAKKKEPAMPKEEAVSIWKDLILLLILLVLLISIGAFFYNHNPFRGDLKNNLTSSLEDIDLCVIPVDTGIEALHDCSDSRSVQADGRSLSCILTINNSMLPNYITISQNDTTLLETKNLDVQYNWLIQRGENLLRTGFEPINELPSTRLKNNDSVVCEIVINTSKIVWKATSSAFTIKNVESSANASTVYTIINQSSKPTNNSVITPNTTKDKQEIINLIKYIKENNLTNSFQNLIVEEGSVISVDLTNYFVDPDNDSLTFALDYQTSDNISIDIWKGNATIKSSPGFIGIVNASITAVDPSGESVTGEMRVISGPRTPKTEYKAVDFVKNYLLYIIIGILILGLILLLLIYLDKSSNMEQSKDNNKDNNKE